MLEYVSIDFDDAKLLHSDQLNARGFTPLCESLPRFCLTTIVVASSNHELRSHLFRHFCGSKKGATADVEAAIVISDSWSSFSGSLIRAVYWTWNTMLLAIEEGGRYAMIYNPTNYTCGPPPPSCPGSPTQPCPSNNAITAVTWTLAQCAVAKAIRILSTYLAPTVVTRHVHDGPSGCTTVSSTVMTIEGTFTFNIIGSSSLPGSVTMTRRFAVSARNPMQRTKARMPQSTYCARVWTVA